MYLFKSKGLRNPHSLLTSRKLKRQKSATLLGSIRKVRAKDKLLPSRLERQTGEYRESRFTRAESRVEIALATSVRVGKPELQLTNI